MPTVGQIANLSYAPRQLAAWTAQRRQIARWYEERLADVPGVIVPAFRASAEPTFRHYATRVPQRDIAFERLLGTVVQASLHCVPSLHLQRVYLARRLSDADRLPVTEMVAEQIVRLPMEPELGLEEVEFAAGAVRDALAAQGAFS